MKPTTQNSELISALADGQLAGDDFAAALAMCETDSTALASWESYHLIGDVLRLPQLQAQAVDNAFVERLRARLAQEQAVVAAVPMATPAPVPVRADKAANDSRFTWKLVAGFASLAAVVAVAWNAGSGSLSPAAGPQLARTEAPQQVLVMSGQGPMVRDARMMELLAEHKQFGGTSALQMPSGFLRNATFETSQGERR
ncbi:MAG: sigma-E factor negative regulatory protein [Polaromonas sp.]|nr:sigma-E factor negative regulatory protein [Polaromonas sp.]